jgi:hypothetical protein
MSINVYHLEEISKWKRKFVEILGLGIRVEKDEMTIYGQICICQ